MSEQSKVWRVTFKKGAAIELEFDDAKIQAEVRLLYPGAATITAVAPPRCEQHRARPLKVVH